MTSEKQIARGQLPPTCERSNGPGLGLSNKCGCGPCTRCKPRIHAIQNPGLRPFCAVQSEHLLCLRPAFAQAFLCAHHSFGNEASHVSIVTLARLCLCCATPPCRIRPSRRYRTSNPV